MKLSFAIVFYLDHSSRRYFLEKTKTKIDEIAGECGGRGGEGGGGQGKNEVKEEKVDFNI